jgi:hypothetical protein
MKGVRKGIPDNTDRVTNGDVIIDFLPFQLSGVTEDVTIVLSF